MNISNQVINHPSLQVQNDINIFNVVKETLYPGSTDAEAAMILAYCKARRIDPILKPVFLVPMNVKTGKKGEDGKDIYERKNIVIPGIGLYRIDASRSGQYAGMNEPEFGDDITEKLGNIMLTYPKWCKVTVKKLLNNGSVAEFSAKEYWKENYVTKARSDKTPNEVWEKRAYGQLAKCAEAQALRKAFPDVVGSEYTKEEMEGKSYFNETSKTYSHWQNALILEENNIVDDKSHQLLADFEDATSAIEKCESEEQLKNIFNSVKKIDFSSQPDLLKKIIEAKDRKKIDIKDIEKFKQELNEETGEVIS